MGDILQEPGPTALTKFNVDLFLKDLERNFDSIVTYKRKRRVADGMYSLCVILCFFYILFSFQVHRNNLQQERYLSHSPVSF